MTLTACLLLLTAGEAANSPPTQFHFPFRSGVESQSKIKLFGPDVKEVSKFDDQGMTITLPVQRPKSEEVGTEATFGAQGDFEVTLTYDLVHVDEPEADSFGGVGIRLILDNAPFKAVTMARLRRRFKESGVKDTFGANVVTVGPDGKDKYQTKLIPATAPQGGLRLARSGGTLRYFAADGLQGSSRSFDRLTSARTRSPSFKLTARPQKGRERWRFV